MMNTDFALNAPSSKAMEAAPNETGVGSEKYGFTRPSCACTLMLIRFFIWATRKSNPPGHDLSLLSATS